MLLVHFDLLDCVEFLSFFVEALVDSAIAALTDFL